MLGYPGTLLNIEIESLGFETVREEEDNKLVHHRWLKEIVLLLTKAIKETMELSRTIREKSIKNVLVLGGNQLIYFIMMANSLCIFKSE
jgi:hypothetical protein